MEGHTHGRPQHQSGSMQLGSLLPIPVLFISVRLVVIPTIAGTIIIFRWPFGLRIVILSSVLILNHIATVLVGSIAMEASTVSTMLMSTSFEVLTQNKVKSFDHLLLLQLGRPQGDEVLLFSGQVCLSQQMPTLNSIRESYIVFL